MHELICMYMGLTNGKYRMLPLTSFLLLRAFSSLSVFLLTTFCRIHFYEEDYNKVCIVNVN